MLGSRTDEDILSVDFVDKATDAGKQRRYRSLSHLFFHGYQACAKTTMLVGALLMPLCALGAFAQQPSIMIWPIKPVLEGNQKSTAVWIENRGSRAVTLQARIVAWNQQDNRDNYTSMQQMVALSPPLATVAPGNRQLLRVVRLQKSSSNQERAFRILLDELPEATNHKQLNTNSDARTVAMGVRFRMRYSLPLFLRGADFDASHDSRNAPDFAKNELVWKMVQIERERWIEVHNPGRVHARLTAVRLLHQENEYRIADGLLGYVLSGSSMRWRIPEAVPTEEALRLKAKVNGKDTLLIASR